MKATFVTLGVGAAVGAIAILMMPKSNPTRKLAAQAALKVEDAAHKLGDKLNQTVGM